MPTAMPLANHLVPRQPAQRHGGARCIEQGRAVPLARAHRQVGLRRASGTASARSNEHRCVCSYNLIPDG